MRSHFAKHGSIYLEKPEFLTIRGELNGVDADFVPCRKDGHYSDGRRPDSVSPGTILDDLARRDFTVNAIAVDANGNYIDPFSGRDDIKRALLRCVGDPRDRFREDSLRLLRAIRFSLTKGLYVHDSIRDCLRDKEMLALLRNVSVERVREELLKCFEFSTSCTLDVLSDLPDLKDVVFSMPIKLKPTIIGRYS